MIINSPINSIPLNTSELDTSTRSAPPANADSLAITRSDAVLAPVDEAEKPSGDIKDDDNTEPGTLHDSKEAGTAEESAAQTDPVIEQLKKMIEELKEQIQKAMQQYSKAKNRVEGPDDMAGLATVEAASARLVSLQANLTITYSLLADALKKSENSSGSATGQMLETQA